MPIQDYTDYNSSSVSAGYQAGTEGAYQCTTLVGIDISDRLITNRPLLSSQVQGEWGDPEHRVVHILEAPFLSIDT